MLALENERVNLKRSITWCLVITLVITVVIGFMPTLETTDGQETVTFGLEDYPTRFWSYVAIALVSLAGVVYLFCFCRAGTKGFFRSTSSVSWSLCSTPSFSSPWARPSRSTPGTI